MQTELREEYTVLETVSSIKKLFFYLLSKWYIILIVGVICGLLGIWYAWVQKPEYKATLSFATESEGSSAIGAYAGIAAQFGLDIGGGSNNAFEGDNLIHLLKSRDLIERTLLSPVAEDSKELLIEYYLRVNETNKDWHKKESLKNLKFVVYPSPENRIRDSIIGLISKSMKDGQLDVAKADKKLDVIEIRVIDNDEFFAKRFAELLTSNAINYYTDYKIKKTRQNVQILQRQTDSVRGTLFGNITQVATLNDLNVNPLRQVTRTGAQRKQVDVQVNSILYGELLKNLELSKLSLRKQTPLIQIIDSPKLPLEKKKMGRLMGGIIFSFIGGFLVCLFLILKYWFSSLTQQPKTVYEANVA